MGLSEGSDGNLYGTTQCGGTWSAGTVFKVTTAGVETVLRAFSGGGALPGNDDGGYPDSPLIQAMDGNFYGLTSAGGNPESRDHLPPGNVTGAAAITPTSSRSR